MSNESPHQAPFAHYCASTRLLRQFAFALLVCPASISSLPKCLHAQVDSAFLAEFSQQPEETDGTGNLIQIWLNDKATDAELKTVGGETHLVRLYINGDNVTNDGIAALIDLTELKTLRIESPNLTDAGLRHLKSMKKLSSLLLGHTGIISGQR